MAFKAKYKVLVNLFLEKRNAELAEQVCVFVTNST